MDQLKSESSNDQTEGLQQTQPIDYVSDSDSPVDSPKAPTGYATIGKRITNFTTNLLATSVITMVALVAGSHFVSSLRPLTQATDDSISTELTNAWPVLESCALQFGESNIELQRDSLIGNREEVLGFLQSKCRDVLEQNLVPTGEPLDNEASLVSELLKSNSVQPVQESPGQWRIFQIEKPELNSPLPLDIRIRDDGPLPSNEDDGELEAEKCCGEEDDRDQQRRCWSDREQNHCGHHQSGSESDRSLFAQPVGETRCRQGSGDLHDRCGEDDQTNAGRRQSIRVFKPCLLYTSPSPRDATLSRMPSSA